MVPNLLTNTKNNVAKNAKSPIHFKGFCLLSKFYVLFKLPPETSLTLFLLQQSNEAHYFQFCTSQFLWVPFQSPVPLSYQAKPSWWWYRAGAEIEVFRTCFFNRTPSRCCETLVLTGWNLLALLPTIVGTGPSLKNLNHQSHYSTQYLYWLWPLIHLFLLFNWFSVILIFLSRNHSQKKIIMETMASTINFNHKRKNYGKYEKWKQYQGNLLA